jgi:hypothetical protein
MIQNIKSIGAKVLVAAALGAGTLMTGAAPAEARGSVVIGAHFGGGGYYRPHYRPNYWRGGPSFSVGFGTGPYWGGRYAPYYYPYPYYRSSMIYRSYDNDYAYTPAYDRRGGLLSSSYVQQALAADVGESITWANGGAIGRVTTTRDGWSGEKYCREFVEDITVDGTTHETTGTACQAPGGAWQMVANQP